MDGVPLRDALTIAARYTDPKASDRALHVVVLRDGMIRATNYYSGCEIPCPDVAGLDLAVDCAAMRRMVGAIGDGAKLSTAKGRKLSIEGGGVKYKLQAIPKNAEPTFPDAPTGDWRAVTKAQMVALAAIAGMVDTKAKQLAFQGLRLTEGWCGAATQNLIAFAWITGLVTKEERFTTPPGIFEDMAEDTEMLVVDGRMYLRAAATGQVRWSLGLEADWPDDSLSQALLDARKRDRGVAAVRLGDLGLLCKQAAVVAENAAQGFRMTLDGSGLTLEGAAGAADFKGTVPVSGYTAPVEAETAVGIEPTRMAALCAAVEAAGGDGYQLAVAGALSPIMAWNYGADVIVETLTMPMRLE